MPGINTHSLKHSILSLVFSAFLVLAFIGIHSLVRIANAQTAAAEDNRPNILLIVADDFGWADLKSYGGDIIAPSLDALANESRMFSNFHVMPVCSGTRAMILTGVDDHRNGMGTMDVILTPNQKDQPGYETYLNDRVVTVAQLLNESGYHTYLSGKWHVGANQENWPYNRGFEESFSLLHGAGLMWNGTFPIDAYKVMWARNDKLVDWPNGNYSSDQYANEIINMIAKNHKDGKPFFGYVGYQATHFPLQAPPEYLKANEGRYDMGYDKLREQRLENQKRLGLISEGAQLAERSPKVPPWEQLSADVKRNESKKMEVFAADAQAMDYSIGRIIDYLKKIGEYDNTLIMFTTDNGGESERVEELNLAPEISADVKEYIRSLNSTEENLGNWNSFVTYGPSWAQVSNTPFKGFKGQLTEGGIRVPFIMKVPGNSSHEIVKEFATGYDLVSTFLDYAKVNYPNSFNGINLEPLSGKSMLPLAEGQAEEVHSESEIIPMEYFGVEAVYKGNWKTINLPKELGGDGQWHLYDIATDPQESQDLSKDQPALFQELIAAYDIYANQTRIIPPDYGVLGLGVTDETAFDG